MEGVAARRRVWFGCQTPCSDLSDEVAGAQRRRQCPRSSADRLGRGTRRHQSKQDGWSRAGPELAQPCNPPRFSELEFDTRPDPHEAEHEDWLQKQGEAEAALDASIERHVAQGDEWMCGDP